MARLVVFALDVGKIQELKQKFDMRSADPFLLEQFCFGDLFILEGRPNYRYLRIVDAETIPLISGLKHGISEAKKRGSDRVSGYIYESYDLEIRVSKRKCLVSNLHQPDGPTIEVDLEQFTKSVYGCGLALYQTLLWVFPELASNPQLETIYKELV